MSAPVYFYNLNIFHKWSFQMNASIFDEKKILSNQAYLGIENQLPSKKEIDQMKDEFAETQRIFKGFGAGLIGSLVIWIILLIAIWIAWI
jgi:hypothetical protein